ncbi:MAG: hypothetical protein ACRCVG_01235 [Methanobacteriaceae archaeon]
MNDKIKDNKLIIILVVAIAVIAIIGAITYNTDLSTSLSGPEKIIKVKQKLSAVYPKNNPNDIEYGYTVYGEVQNLRTFGDEYSKYDVKASFYDSENNVVDEDSDTIYSREDHLKSFDVRSEKKSKINMSKVVIELINPDGDIVANYTFNINMDLMEEPKGYEPYSSSSSSSNTSSSSSSSDSSSSSSLGTFDDGFKAGVKDAYAGKSSKYSSYDYYYGNNNYKAGYYDGYQNYLSYPQYK